MNSQAFCCDCLEGFKRLSDASIDLTVTSPPYDNLRTYKGYTFEWKPVLEQLFRVTKQGGVVVWIVNDATVNGSETGTSFKQALYAMECGFNLHDTMIWKKDSCAFPEETRYYPNFEYMFIFSKGKPKTLNFIEDRKNLWGGEQCTRHFYEGRRNKSEPLGDLERIYLQGIRQKIQCVGDTIREEQ